MSQMGRQKERVSKEASAVEDPKLYYSTEAYEYKVESAEEAKDSKAKPRPRVK